MCGSVCRGVNNYATFFETICRSMQNILNIKNLTKACKSVQRHIQICRGMLKSRKYAKECKFLGEYNYKNNKRVQMYAKLYLNVNRIEKNKGDVSKGVKKDEQG